MPLPATGGGATIGAALALAAAAAAARGAEIGRRQFLALGGLAIGAAALPAVRAGAAEADESLPARPNILWFRSEDNSADLVGAYGNELAQTPNMDRLAAEGVRFDNFFTTSPVCAPTKLGWTTGMYEAAMGPGHNMRAQGRRPDFAVGFATWLADAGYWCATSGRTDYNSDLEGVDGYHDHSGDWQTGVENGQPFFALLGTELSHETVSFAPLPTATNPVDVDLPAYHPDDPVLRLDRAAYIDRLTLVDDELGHVLDELESLGVADDTIVIYSSDHGGVLPRSKRFCYDSGLRAPLIMRFPDRWQHLAPASPGSVWEPPVSSVDAAPTVLSLAGLPVPDHMQGVPVVGPSCVVRDHVVSNRNRMDEAVDFVRTIRDERYRYIRNYMPHLPWGQHIQFMWLQAGVRQWELLHELGTLNEVQDRFWNTKPAEELYDLATDPDEVFNLVDAPEHQHRLARMRQLVDDHMVRINDNGFIPEGSDVEGYDQSRVRGAYPLTRLMALGWSAIQRDPSNLPRLVAALGDPNEVVRYWGALGCSMLGTEAAPAADDLAARMGDLDETAWVRVQSADALCRVDQRGAAVTYLGDVAADGGAIFPVRLQAVRSLTLIGPAAAASLPQLAVAATADNEYVRNAAVYGIRVVSGTYAPAP